MSIESECISHHTTCMCGGYSRDHDVVFHYWPDKELGDDFTISTGLNHYLPWYKRALIALKYTLGIDNTYISHVETALNEVELKKLQTYINSVCDTFQENPPRNQQSSAE